MSQPIESRLNSEVTTGWSASIPPVFCWSKMGSEGGQGLKHILRRKELERQAGNGMFAWGIGNSIAPALDRARRMGWRDIEAIFTPMLATPKPADVEPDAVVLWRSYVGSDGRLRDLPAHIVVTSRESGASGSAKKMHYALLCHSALALQEQETACYIDRSRTRNFVSENSVGASQVTAIVSYHSDFSGLAEKRYPVTFRATLVDECFVRLARAVRLQGRLAGAFNQACHSTTRAEWEQRTHSLKTVAAQYDQGSSQSQLFALEDE